MKDMLIHCLDGFKTTIFTLALPVELKERINKNTKCFQGRALQLSL